MSALKKHFLEYTSITGRFTACGLYVPKGTATPSITAYPKHVNCQRCKVTETFRLAQAKRAMSTGKGRE
jgi:hypothetical protein